MTRRVLAVLAVVGVLIGVVGCASAPAVQPRMAFPEHEYKALPSTGTATVRGQAFLKTRGGDVKTAAGNVVLLNPVTSYSLEWYEKSYLGGVTLTPPDQRLFAYTRQRTADAAGGFTFKNVPAGEYFITAVVQWEAPTGYQGALQVQGGAVTKRVTVREGDDVEVIVTR